MAEISGSGMITRWPAVPEQVQKERQETFQRFYESARPARFIMDAVIATAIALVEGHQWLIEQSRSASRSTGRVVYQSLPDKVDPGVDNVRVTLNRIRDMTEEVAALMRIEPAGWLGHFEPDERDPIGSHVDMQLVRRIWRDYVQTIDLHTEELELREWRAETGAGFLKATPDATNPYGWSVVNISLDRILWDAAVKTPNLANHRQWADCCAWDAAEVTKRYGIQFAKPENLPTLGSLRAFDAAVGAIRGVGGVGGDQSKTPAVLLTEFYDDYSRRLTILVHTGPTPEQSRVVWDGPNPYGRCPLLHLNFGTSLVTPFGIGVPMRLRPEQQILNLAMTGVVRHLLVSAGRWVYEAGSITEPLKAFSPRVGAPLAFTPGRAERPIPPTLVQPMGPNVIAHNLVSALPSLMGEVIHLQPVMQGITSPRGESRAAIVEKLAQAGRVYAANAETDDERVRRFLSYHAKFIANHTPANQIYVAVGQDFKQSAVERYLDIQAGKRTEFVEADVKVSLPPGTIQPKTPVEKEDRLMRLAALKLIAPDRLLWELYKQTGVPVTEEQQEAVANAAEENLRFLEGAIPTTLAEKMLAEGQDVSLESTIDAVNYEPHDIHIFVHRALIRRRHTYGLDPKIVRNVSWHVCDHKEELAEERFQDFAVELEGQGQVGTADQASANLLAESPMSGSLSAPPATPEQYNARDMGQEAQAGMT